MTAPGAASLPSAPEGALSAELPDGEQLRQALRPAALPLPTPRTAAEIAERLHDLLGAGQNQAARDLAARTLATRALAEPPRDAAADGAAADRLDLARALVRVADASNKPEMLQQAAGQYVSLLRRGGHRAQAAATAQVLQEMLTPVGPTAATRAALAQQTPPDSAPSSARGRRRAAPVAVDPGLLAVARALAPLPGADDPARLLARTRAALSALPEVREQLAADPEAELRLRLAQALEGCGDDAAATSAALDVLDLLETPGETAPSDPQHLAAAARALLARTLGLSHPTLAAQHAVTALLTLSAVEDPPLRIGLITSLLRALLAADAQREASFTAGRLISLQRTLQQEPLRVAPLLAVATQRLQAERYEAAWVPLEQAREIATRHRDHRGLLEAARLGASLREREQDQAGSLRELQRLAREARWLADDLATARAEQPELVRLELQSSSLALRRALDLGQRGVVSRCVRAIERRTAPGAGWTGLPPELLWDHRVDARAGALIAAGEELRETADDEAADEGALAAARAELDRCLKQARTAIDAAPPGHTERAEYWRTYVSERYAHYTG